VPHLALNERRVPFFARDVKADQISAIRVAVLCPKLGHDSSNGAACHTLGLLVIGDTLGSQPAHGHGRARERATGTAAPGNTAIQGHRWRRVRRIGQPIGLLQDDERRLGTAVDIVLSDK
jgi:hypothetical protein